MKKTIILALLAIGLASCSKETIDNIGRDTAQNIIRSNKWFDVVKTVSVDGKVELTETLVGSQEGHYMEFKSDGYAYIYSGGTTKSYAYEMPTSKTMVFGGTTYTINENLITAIVKFSMSNTTAGKTTTFSFKRR